MKRIVIIGAGISGLSTAYFLKDQLDKNDINHVEIVLVEKSNHLGGNIRTIKEDGYLIEAGPDSYLSEKPWALALIKRMGIMDKTLTTNHKFQKTYIYSKKKLHPMPEGLILMVPTKIMPMVKTGLISIFGKIRMGMDLILPRGKTGDDIDESFASFVRRRLGKEAFRKIAEPFIAGVHGGDPERMSMKASFPKFVKMEEDKRSLILAMLGRMKEFRKMQNMGKAIGGDGNAPKRPATSMFMSMKLGMKDLIDELLGRLEGIDIRKETLVTDITYLGQSGGNGTYELAIEGEAPLRADSVIIAAPAYGAATILNSMDSGLAEKLKNIPYTSTSTVSLAFDKSQIGIDLDAFGFVIPSLEGKNIVGSTWTSLKWEGRSPSDDKLLLRCFVGGARHEHLVFKTDEELINIVMDDIKPIMKIEGAPEKSWVFRYKKAMPQYVIGHQKLVSGIEYELAAQYDGLFLTGSAYHGVGISDSVREAEETAKKALKMLRIIEA